MTSDVTLSNVRVLLLQGDMAPGVAVISLLYYDEHIPTTDNAHVSSESGLFRIC